MFCAEEICTLVIAEAFPEDGGLFCCTASNPYGSVNCTAHLTVTAGWYDKGDQRGEALGFTSQHLLDQGCCDVILYDW